jgi:hypothetical protein
VQVLKSEHIYHGPAGFIPVEEAFMDIQQEGTTRV